MKARAGYRRRLPEIGIRSSKAKLRRKVMKTRVSRRLYLPKIGILSFTRQRRR